MVEVDFPSISYLPLALELNIDAVESLNMGWRKTCGPICHEGAEHFEFALSSLTTTVEEFLGLDGENGAEKNSDHHYPVGVGHLLFSLPTFVYGPIKSAAGYPRRIARESTRLTGWRV
jgi:hypothetical protein